MRTRYVAALFCSLFLASSATAQSDRFRLSSIETIAGGEPESGVGTEFSLPSVAGLAEDSRGNIYFSIQARNRVYRLDVGGRVSGFAGNGVRDKNLDRVAAASSPLLSPYALAVDGDGNLYVACIGSLVRVDAVSGLLTTVFTTPYRPRGSPNSVRDILQMAIGPNGDLYFSDGADFRIKSYSFASGAITVLAGNGTRGPIETDGSALSSPLSFPRAVAVAPDGTVYFSTLEPAVFRLTRPEGKLEVLNIRVPQAKLPPTDYDMPLTDYDIPSSLALDDKGDLFVAQVNRSRVLRITLQSGEVSVFAGASDRGLSGKSVPASQAAVTAPMYVASDSNGDVTIAERHRIRNIEAANGLIVTVLGGGSPVFSDDSSHAAGFGDLWEPADAVPASDGSVIITSAFSNRLLRLDPQGSLTVLAGGGAYTQVESDPGPADRVTLNFPQGIWLDTNGDIYFSDTSNRIVRLLAAGSGWVKNFATTPKGFNSASPYLIHAAALVGDASYFYLSDPDGGCVWRVSRRDGEVELYAGIAPGSLGPARGGGTGRLMAPSGLALDSAGNLYIADADAGRPGRILRVESGTHRIFTVLPDLRQPSGLAFLSPGVLCFSESAGHRVGCLNLQTGTVKTVAGTGQAGFNGDGGPAECAQLNRPSGISFDADGDLYIADTGNQRIRRVHLGTGSAQCHP